MKLVTRKYYSSIEYYRYEYSATIVVYVIGGSIFILLVWHLISYIRNNDANGCRTGKR
jgi:hypothetical protein